ncbi:hypothetical protein GXW82_25930 [Streptacidiphilus sp. 4-A2]|nr:hypothetical protein [Streptacidiphilus sp. 4-A2]
MAKSSDATIKVPEETRDRLAALAKERGMTIGGLVASLARQELTSEQLAERVREGRRILREQMGVTMADEEFDAMPNVLERVYELGARKAAASAAGSRGSAA